MPSKLRLLLSFTLLGMLWLMMPTVSRADSITFETQSSGDPFAITQSPTGATLISQDCTSTPGSCTFEFSVSTGFSYGPYSAPSLQPVLSAPDYVADQATITLPCPGTPSGVGCQTGDFDFYITMTSYGASGLYSPGVSGITETSGLMDLGTADFANQFTGALEYSLDVQLQEGAPSNAPEPSSLLLLGLGLLGLVAMGTMLRSRSVTAL